MHWTSTRLRSRVPWTASAALLLTACSSAGGVTATFASGKPGVSASASASRPSAQVSPSPSGTPKQQAIVTVHRFFDALNIASRTGDTTAVRAMITPTCCSELIKAIAHDFAGGRHAENGVWTVSAVSIFGQDGPRFYVDATWSLSALRVISANGSVEGSYPARSTRGQLVVARSGDGWVIEHMERFTTGNTQAQR